MTTKETYTLQGNDADGWVDISLQTFRDMLDAGYKCKWKGCLNHWNDPSFEGAYYNEDFAPFRTRHFEYLQYINRTYPLVDVDDEALAFLYPTQRSDTGTEVRKSRPDLLPSEAVLAAGRVLAFGLEKHPDELWKTLSVAEHCAAALRHIYEHQNGPDTETGESHLAHALCRIAFAIARDKG